MKYTCYVVDDEAHAIDALKRHVQTYPGLELLGTTTSELEALENIRKLKPDITFMDIDMPRLSGMDLCEMVKNHTLVIFTTAHAAYAVESYNKDIIDYLLKPISFSRFAQCIDKVKTRIASQTKTSNPGIQCIDYIFISTGIKGTFTKLALKDIYYVKGLNNYVQIYLENTKYITYLTFAELEQKLDANKFIRTHKSYLVNILKVREFNGKTLTLTNHATVPLGKTYTIRFNLFLNKYMLHSKRGAIQLKTS